MASISGEDINTPESSVTSTSGYAFSTFRRAAALLSHTATTLVSSRRSRFRTTFGPQYPYPTTPHLISAGLPCSWITFSAEGLAIAIIVFFTGDEQSREGQRVV